jgi:hypothetical protein
VGVAVEDKMFNPSCSGGERKNSNLINVTKTRQLGSNNY